MAYQEEAEAATMLRDLERQKEVTLAAMERFEDASSVRDSVIDLCAASSRHHRFRGLVDAEQGDGGAGCTVVWPR